MFLICPNPTIDHQIFLDSFAPGAVVRAESNRRLAGGKPIDVTRALGAFDLEPKLLILLPENDRGYRDLLHEEGIAAEILDVPGDVRETIVLYETSGRATVVNGRGSELPRDRWAAAAARILDSVADAEWVVISGSFPPGVTGADLAELTTELHRVGAKVALDVGAAWLAPALGARPDVITPNLAEAGLMLGEGDGLETVDFADDALQQAEHFAVRLHAQGVPRVAVTVGALGTAWANEGQSGVSAAFPAETVNPIGAGDAFLGGVMATLHTGGTFPHALRVGAASAASAVSQWIPGKADRRIIDTLVEVGAG